MTKSPKPGAVGVSPGQTVVSLPVVADQRRIHAVGYSNEYPGGYAERMLLSAGLLLQVPNGLDARRAALTEPMAVGVHDGMMQARVERSSCHG